MYNGNVILIEFDDYNFSDELTNEMGFYLDVLLKAHNIENVSIEFGQIEITNQG
ncbi:hypothetical protein [Methanosarcina siciliae]|uniref:hypothetical protein n=1 Tax=Methanosarcina siciliae TaxID=38027 RepID=UPI000AC8130B|nr:hypothetical protein [Methanosarcina siciliae]